MTNTIICKTCVYPSSKPHIEFNDDGICSACIAHQKRPKIDWKERELRFKEILNLNKKNNPNYYILVKFYQSSKILYIP